MADLQQSQQGWELAEKGLSAFTPDLPGAVQREINKAWTPAMKEASEVTGKKLAGFLPGIFKVPYTGMMAGTTAADVSPEVKLQAMGTRFGELSGGLEQASRYADLLGAKRDEMYNLALREIELGHNFAAQKAARAFQTYQLAWQAAEAEKQRQFQASQAAAARAASQRQYQSITDLLTKVQAGTDATKVQEAMAKPFAHRNVPERLLTAQQKMGFGGKALDILSQYAQGVKGIPTRQGRAQQYQKYWGQLTPKWQEDPTMKRLFQSIGSGRYLY